MSDTTTFPATLVDAIRMTTAYDNQWNREEGAAEFTAAQVCHNLRDPRAGCEHDDIDGAVDDLADRVAQHAILAATQDEIENALTQL
jgi:hypothetical protein